MGPVYSARGFSGLGLHNQREQVFSNLLGRARDARVKNKSLCGQSLWRAITVPCSDQSSRFYVTMYISLVKVVKVFLGEERGNEGTLNWQRASGKNGVILEDVRPRRVVAAVKLDFLESRECAVYAFRDAGGIDPLANAHAPDRQMGEHRVGGHDQGRVGRRWQSPDVHREAEPAQTRALCGERREASGRRAGLHGKVRREVEHLDGTGPEGQFLDFEPPARDGREVAIAQVGRDRRVEYEAAQVDETREWGERSEREMELGREGGCVVKGLAEAGQDFEGKIR